MSLTLVFQRSAALCCRLSTRCRDRQSLLIAAQVAIAHTIIVTVVFLGAEAHGSGGSLARGALRSAIEFRDVLRRLAPAPRSRVRAEVPAVFGTLFSGGRGRDAEGRDAEGREVAGVGRPSLARASFTASGLPWKRLIMQATNSFLSVGSFDELNERKPTRPTGFAVRGQRDVRDRTDCGEVRTEISLSRIIGEVANKKARGHHVFLQFEWCVLTRLSRGAPWSERMCIAATQRVNRRYTLHLVFTPYTPFDALRGG